MKHIARQFKAFSDETRLRILHLLLKGECCICELMAVLELTQSKVSRHMAYLKNAGFVTDRREGVWMYYSLAEPANEIHACQVRCLSGSFQGIEILRQDEARLERIKTERRRGCASCSQAAGSMISGSGKGTSRTRASETGPSKIG